MEGFGYLWIELYDQVVLGSDSAIAFFNYLRDPFAEIIADDCVNHIDDPLPRQLAMVALVRHMATNFLVSESLLQDVLN